MNDSMYNLDWLDMSEEERQSKRDSFEFCLKDDEIVFDAADFTRTGKHIFGQISMTTNRTALEWMHRELEPHGFVVHPLHIQQETTPSHIDCTLVVLKPGLVMENVDR
jgi:glycine amidinotransferase